jgi:S-adenosylmethionine decarboxylase
MHLIIDGYGNNRELLQDEGVIYELLDSYPAQLGMTKISPPYVYRYIGDKAEEWGISGLILIAESHISIHTFVEYSFVNIDVFSCKDFDSEKAIKDWQERFQLTQLRTHLIDRSQESFSKAASLLQVQTL